MPSPPYGLLYSDLSYSTVVPAGSGTYWSLSNIALLAVDAAPTANPTFTGTVTVSGSLSLAAPATAESQAPQWGQVLAGNNAQWYQMVSTRALSTTYTNSYGRPISVSILAEDDSTANSVLEGHINGTAIFYTNGTASNYHLAFNFIVPAYATYEVIPSAGTTATLLYWNELY